MMERYGRDLRRGAFAAFVIVFPMFVTVLAMVMVLDVYRMAVMTISEG